MMAGLPRVWYGTSYTRSPEEDVKKTYIKVTLQSKSTELLCLEDLKDLPFK